MVAMYAASVNGPIRMVAITASVLPLADNEKHHALEPGSFPEEESIRSAYRTWHEWTISPLTRGRNPINS
jgi:hypothetical protein